ncbi:cytochrome c3 family protein [Thermogutta sp.]|uniref:cytochrome c3 family protein n=1 Tax=Thermogutta sp. TaxID=1962930 RepID=UPI00322027C1
MVRGMSKVEPFFPKLPYGTSLALVVGAILAWSTPILSGMVFLPEGGSTPSSDRAASENKPAAADNSPCLVCHANFEEEPLSRRHARAGVGCVKCHGESFDHRSDENNTTPPDRMFPRSEIDRACRECHPTHNVPAKLVVATYLKRCREITNPDKLVCTDCHGKHRMNTRTILWDKRTGRLLGPGEKPAE